MDPAKDTSGEQTPAETTPSAYNVVPPNAPAGGVVSPDNSVFQPPIQTATGPVVPGAPNPMQPAPNPTGATFGGPDVSAPRKRKGKFLLAGGAALLLAVLAGGYVFGYYLPNRPSSIWNDSLGRTGSGLQGLVQKATGAQGLQAYKGADMSGTLSVRSDTGNFTGSFTSATDGKNGSLHASFGNASAPKQFGLDLLVAKPKSGVYPDIYARISGLSDPTVALLVPGIATYDNKWISISSDYLQQLANQTGADSLNTGAASQTPTPKDVSDLAKALADQTTTYLFTADSNKAVLMQKKFIGKEGVDGVATYHYTATINKVHAQEFCVALGDTMVSSNVYKKLSGASAADISKAKQQVSKDCPGQVNDMLKSTGDIDVWMDSTYKLVYKIRLHDKEKPADYVEFGQHYIRGNAMLSIFFNAIDATAKTSLKSTYNINLTTKSLRATVSYDNHGSTPYSAKVSLAAHATNEPLSISPPANATPFQDLLKQFTGSSTL